MAKQVRRWVGLVTLVVLMQGSGPDGAVFAQSACDCWGVAQTWKYPLANPLCGSQTYNVRLSAWSALNCSAVCRDYADALGSGMCGTNCQQAPEYYPGSFTWGGYWYYDGLSSWITNSAYPANAC